MEECAAGDGVTVRNDHQSRALPGALLARLAAAGAEVLKKMGERYHDRVKPPETVSIVLIDDAEIARVHGEFMGKSEPTDVITFPYAEEGEILISIDTAERQAARFQASLERELALYVVHGVLHLCGYRDETDSERREMEELQEGLLAEIFDGD